MRKNIQEEPVKVSVFCLAYNHEKYIRHTLDGFVGQITNFRYEVIIHDDASSDQTLSIIREYEKKYPDLIKVIAEKENQYSKGIDILESIIYPNLKGEYIALCEGDDYWNDSGKLQKQFDALERHRECSLSTHRVKCCNEDGSDNDRIIPESYYEIERTGVISNKELAQCYWVRGGYPFHTSSYFFRRNVIDVDLKYPNDIGILRKCLVLGQVYFIDEIMSTRRLWSLNNWNTSLAKSSAEIRYKTLIHNPIELDRTFDEFTKYEYHDYIKYRECILLLAGLEFGTQENKDRIKKWKPYKIYFGKIIPIKKSFPVMGKLIMLHYMPELYLVLKKLKQVRH